MNGVYHSGATSARLTQAMENAAPHLRPILLAIRDYRVGGLFVSQGAEAFRLPTKPARPTVVLIGDDMERSMGPEGFHLPSIRRAIRACGSFTIVTSAPTLAIYAAGTTGAVAGGKVMIVETRLEHEFQWLALIQKLAPGRPILLSTVQGGRA